MYLFQRDEKTEDGKEIYLWYISDVGRWQFSDGENFQAKNNWCFMYIVSPGKN